MDRKSAHAGLRQVRRGLVLGSVILAALPSLAAAKAPASAAQQPPTDAPSDADIIVTGRFLNSGASSATKLDIPVLDTPFSVAAYNKNFLNAIETANVSDLYRYMTGIQRAGNTGYDISFRGFKTSGNDRNAILTDGLPGLSVRFGSPPTVGTDHIELVKGATSVLYGQAQPGGFINIITKKPLSHAANEITLRGTAGLGTFHRQLGGLISIDSTGPLEASGNLDYRVVAEVGDSRGFRKDSYERPIYIAPSIAIELGPRTKLILQGEFRRVKTHYDTYLVAPNKDVSLIAPIDTAYQEPNDYLTERGLIGTVLFTHEISSAVKFNLNYRYVDHVDTQNNFDVVGFKAATTANPTAPLTTLNRRARGQINNRTYSFVDSNISAKFETFGIRHTLLVGGGGGEETASLNRTQFYNCTCTALDVNVSNPVLGTVGLPSQYPLDTSATLANLTWRYTTQNSIGVYASDLIEFSDMFKVMLGVRYADEHQTIQDLRKPAGVTFKADHKTLPMVGILFRPVPNVSAYASYSTAFVPQAAASQDNFGNNPFLPTFSKAYEAGIKAELLDKRINVSAAYFDIRKNNTLNTFTCLTAAQLTAGGIAIPTGAIIASGTCSTQIGQERSTGFEIEFNGSPLPGWTLEGGFAHTNARVTQSNIIPQVGAQLTNSPSNAFNIWSRYDFKSGMLDNFGFGLGVSSIGARAGLLPTVAAPTAILALPAYTTVDLGLYYKASSAIDMTFKVTNLFDQRYIESAGFTGDINLVPGTPRFATLTARIHF